jgi:hypothetical protein
MPESIGLILVLPVCKELAPFAPVHPRRASVAIAERRSAQGASRRVNGRGNPRPPSGRGFPRFIVTIDAVGSCATHRFAMATHDPVSGRRPVPCSRSLPDAVRQDHRPTC